VKGNDTTATAVRESARRESAANPPAPDYRTPLGLAVAVGMIPFLNRSRLGLSMRALANDREISGLVGCSAPQWQTGARPRTGLLQ
jgi:ABC-type uncharacterized transport system permease subunit